MLKIEAEPVFEVAVQVNTAAIKGSFKAQFLALPTDELEKLDTGAASAWREVLKRVVRGFEPVQVCGEWVDGEQADGLAKLLRWPGVGPAMLGAYYRGLWEAASGN